MTTNNNWVRLGGTILNLDNMAYCELDGRTYQGKPCVRIVFPCIGPEGYEQAVTFSDEDYQPVRQYLERILTVRCAGGINLPSESIVEKLVAVPEDVMLIDPSNSAPMAEFEGKDDGKDQPSDLDNF